MQTFRLKPLILLVRTPCLALIAVYVKQQLIFVYQPALCHTENTYQLQKHKTSKSGKYGSFVVRLQLIKFESEAIQELGPSRDDQELTTSSSDQPTARPSDEAKLPLEDQVAGLFNAADCSAATLSNAKGMSVIKDSTDIVDTGITMGDSDGFALVCGYVEKLIEIGNVVSQVST
jgi:hypothetical protein